MTEEKRIPIFTQRKKNAENIRSAEILQEYSTEVNNAKNILAKAAWDRAFLHYESGNIDRAVSDLDLIINLAPNEINPLDEVELGFWNHFSNYLAQAYLQRGICIVFQGRYEKAIEDFTKSIKLLPSSQAHHHCKLATAAIKNLQQNQENSVKLKEYKEFPFPKNDQLMAENYAKLALLEQNKEEFHKALLFYSEAIRLQPNIHSYYHNRALVHQKISPSSAEAITDRRMVATLLLESKKPSLPPYPLGAQETESLPTTLTHYIGGFEDSATLHAHLQTNKANHFVLTPLMNKRRLDLAQVEQQWNELSQIKNIKEFFKPGKEPAAEDLPFLLGNNHKLRVLLLQNAIIKNAFALIRFLKHHGLDINKPWIENFTVSVTRCKGHRDFREIYQDIEHRQRENTAIDLAIKTEPFPAEAILRMLNLGFIVDKGFNASILLGAYKLLAQQRSLDIARSCLVAAGKLIMLGSNQELDKIPNARLSILIKAGEYIAKPFIKRMEVIFLIRELRLIIPSKLNPLADKRDLTYIEAAIAQLEKLLHAKELTAAQIAQLQEIKLDLIVHSLPIAGQTPSNLRLLLETLRKEYPTIFRRETEEQCDHKLKPLSSTTNFAPSRNLNSSRSSASPSCSSSSSNMSSSSFSTSISQTFWESGQKNQLPDSESHTPDFTEPKTPNNLVME